LEFQGFGGRRVAADFSAGQVSSDAGALLLREVERGRAIIKRLAGCFVDHRRADRREFTVEQLVAQRVYAPALGYEDLNDHERLKRDPLLAMLAGRHDLSGGDRLRARDEIMDWCEGQAVAVDYVFGLARNSRLEQQIARRPKTALKPTCSGPFRSHRRLLPAASTPWPFFGTPQPCHHNLW
jgi:hypothetical protein